MDKKNISDSESIILRLLLESENPMSINDIITKLKEQNINWAYTTVATFLTRLNKKEIVGIKKKKRVYYYYSLAKENDVTNRAKNFVDRYFQSSLSRFLTTFSKDNNISKEELKKLKEWVNKLDDK